MYDTNILSCTSLDAYIRGKDHLMTPYIIMHNFTGLLLHLFFW